MRRRRRARLTKQKRLNRRALVFVVTLVALLSGFAWSLSYLQPAPTGRALSIDQLSALASEHRVVSAVFGDEDALLSGTFLCSAPAKATAEHAAPEKAATSPLGSPVAPGPSCRARTLAGAESKAAAGVTSEPNEQFWLPYPKSDSTTSVLLAMLTEAGARVSVDPQTPKAQVRVVATFLLPLMILANLFGLLFTVGKGGGSAIGEVTNFGTMRKGKLRRGQAPPVTFADVAGADEALDELKEVRDYLADPDRYDQIGAQPPKGVLLVGSPGVGKTLLAKAVAGEVGVPFFSVAGAEFVESLVGVGAARIRDLFQRVRASAPAVVFIDELDAAGRKRAAGGGSGGTDEREQTLNQLLVEMDGFEVSSGIVIMAATNRPDILDPALLRPGRFDRHVTIERPDLLGRTEILELHARNKPVAADVDFGLVARRTPGFSGADLANVVNEAALLAVRQGKPEVEMTDLEEAIQRSLTGAGRKGRMLSPEERKRVAYHEGGHVIVAAAIGRLEQVHRVSILTQGRNAGSTVMAGEGDASIFSRTHLRSKLVTLLGGVAAEELIFDEPSTGSEKDLEAATDLARDMVARYGMSPRLGRMRLLAKDVDEFLDADIPFAAISGQTQHDVDAEVRRLLDEAEQEATALLTTHHQTLDLLASRLETEETLEGPDLEALLTMVRPEVELFGGLATSQNGSAPADHVGIEF
jgi:cell division protease FtsH